MTQQTKIIIGIVSIAVFISGAVWLGAPKNDSKPNSAPSLPLGLMPDMTSYDFGQIQMRSGKVTHPFTMRNITNEPIKLSRMYTSCMCTTATIVKNSSSTAPGMTWRMGPMGMPGHGPIPSLNKVINPNEEFTIEAVFDPAAHGPAGVGPIERVVYLESENSAPVELMIKALVTP